MLASRLAKTRLLAALVSKSSSTCRVGRARSVARVWAATRDDLGAALRPRYFATTDDATSTSGDKAAPQQATEELKEDIPKEDVTKTQVAQEEAVVEEAPKKEIPKETLQFQAETRQLLDIVTNSLYTDKEVFLRELVSNASDALEKLRHMQAANTAELIGGDLPLEIRIDLDEVESSITISDTGVGMTRDEMVSNLGTIARSGSKNFIQQLKNAGTESELDPSSGIIGKFGVGFYSAFMVADKVEVSSRSALKSQEDEPAKVWSSDGSGTFDIRDLEEDIRQHRGSSVKIFLRPDFWGMLEEKRIENILKKYSNFVGFPILVNGKRVNTIDAIWARDPKEVKADEYSDFYQYIASALDEPLDICHFRADAPLEIKALFFIPSFHNEKYGMTRMEPGVSLYSRKVLIEAKSPDILPDWLRFVRGVVDSEDLPLAISREKPQDSALVAKLRKALTRKIISHLAKMRKDDRNTYVNEFYKEYQFFLKEGICQDYEFQAQLAKLLYFETNKSGEKNIICFDEYIANMRPEQKEIYYIVAPSRRAALSSPYLEAFEKAGVEVIFMFSAIDDFVMGNMGSYEGRKLVSVDKGDIDLSELTPEEDKKEKDEIYEGDRELSADEATKFCAWFKTQLGDKKVGSCTVTSRLSSSPAIVTDNESGATRRLMRMVDTSEGGSGDMELPKQNVEINPKHQIIIGIHDIMDKEPTLARVLAEQIYDNCLVAAGLMDDSRSMLPRLNDLLMCVVSGAKGGPDASSPTPATSDDTPSSVDTASSDDTKEATPTEEPIIMEAEIDTKNEATFEDEPIILEAETTTKKEASTEDEPIILDAKVDAKDKNSS